LSVVAAIDSVVADVSVAVNVLFQLPLMRLFLFPRCCWCWCYIFRLLPVLVLDIPAVAAAGAIYSGCCCCWCYITAVVDAVASISVDISTFIFSSQT
jgi:hypothetical protein